MTRCEEFYEKLERDGNFCGLDPETVARILKYRKEMRILKGESTDCRLESPIGDIEVSETALRSLVKIPDSDSRKPEMRKQVVNLVKEKKDKGGSPVVTNREVKNIVEQFTGPALKAICKVTGNYYEYTEYGLNIYQGCPHRCSYCYAVSSRCTSDNAFPQKIEVTKKASLENLESDLKNWKGERPVISLCHLCDPYPAGRDTTPTHECLKLFQKYDHPVQVITKGRKSDAVRDFDLYGPKSRFCVSLTFDNPTDSLKYEPNAVLPEERITALKEAHKRGIITMVSLEPVIDPAQSLHLIDMTHEFVDHYGVGKLNHNEKEGRKTDWRQYRKDAEAKLQGYGYTENEGVGEGKTYMIKKTLKVAPEFTPQPKTAEEQPQEQPELDSKQVLIDAINTLEEQGMSLEDIKELFLSRIEAKQALRSSSPLSSLETVKDLTIKEVV